MVDADGEAAGLTDDTTGGKAVSAPDAIRSPRIRQLRDDVVASGEAALAAFWQEIEASGAPLIEEIAGQADRRLVTFLWREDAAQSLETIITFDVLSGISTAGDIAERQLHKLPGTDCWYRSVVVASNLRTSYRFIPNDDLSPIAGEMDYFTRIAKAVGDPLNPNRLFAPWMTFAPDWVRSDAPALDLPDAPPYRWRVKRDVPAGTLAEETWASERLGNERRIVTWTPPGYETATDDAMLLVQFDAEFVNGLFDVVLENLHADGAVRPIVAVMVGNVERNAELPCNAAFADFLADELVPAMRERFRIAPGPESVIVSGASYGGLAAMWAGLTRPDAFGNVLAQSGSYWWWPDPVFDVTSIPAGAVPPWGWLPERAATWAPVPTRFWMEVGTLEAQGRGPIVSLLASNRQMRDVLVAKGHDVRYREYAGGHDWFYWPELAADALMYLAPPTAH
ncbi:MAG: alpha/beta hydrolase-fold protein [Thermomicrobiales bacterium]